MWIFLLHTILLFYDIQEKSLRFLSQITASFSIIIFIIIFNFKSFARKKEFYLIASHSSLQKKSIMNSIIKTTAVFAAFTTVSTLSNAQKSELPPLEIGFGLGTLVYQGDLTKSITGSYAKLHPAINVFASKPLDNYFSLKLSVTAGRISEDEARYTNLEWKQLRSFSFTTSVTELAATVKWNVYGENSYENYRRFSPYVFAGAGISFLNIQRDYSKTNRAVFDSKTSTGFTQDSLKRMPKALPVIPLGVGAQYALSPNLSLFGEANYRFGFSDYLDGFSYAADPSANDSYYGITIGISYKLHRNGSTKCPPIRR